jgi:hypothetical protein
MSAVLPFSIDTGDWLRDPQLSMCSPATRGIWFDLLCTLHDLGRSGQVTGTPEKLSRTCRCTPAEFVEAMAELSAAGAADISDGRNGEVTIVNRRMQREHKERVITAERVRRHRSNATVTDGVTNGVTPPDTPNDTPPKRKRNKKESESAENADIYINNINHESSNGEEDISANAKNDRNANVTASLKDQKPKKVADIRSKCPAILACLKVAGFYPNKELYDAIIAVLGENPDIERLTQLRLEWLKRGFNPRAWTWVIDWYATGIPDRGGFRKESNARTQGNQADTRKTTEDFGIQDAKRVI